MDELKNMFTIKIKFIYNGLYNVYFKKKTYFNPMSII